MKINYSIIIAIAKIVFFFESATMIWVFFWSRIAIILIFYVSLHVKCHDWQLYISEIDMEKQIIKDEDLQKAAQEGMDAFVDVFVQAYLNIGGGQVTAELFQRLNAEQITLLAYCIFRDEIMEGGFCQLIQNGYGPFIFENPFAKAMRLWGLKDLSKQIYKAREIYDAHKEDLTKERTDDEFMAMYEQYEAFDEIEEWFIEEEEALTGMVAYYVDENIENFII